MSFAQLEAQLKGGLPQTIAVAGAEGDELFQALERVEQKGLARFVLVGESETATALAERYGIDPVAVISAGSEEDVAARSVAAIKEGKAALLMKGKVSTPTLLHAVVTEKSLFPKGQLLSHALVVESPEGRMLGITDGGMNIRPDIEAKQTILNSAVELFHRLGLANPKVAVLAANEKVNSKMPETLDAVQLKERYQAGAISGCIVDGPMALDLAVVPRAAALKGYQGAIQGDADILLTHDIAAGNHLGKSLLYLGGFQGGGIILGASYPIVLLSRSDTVREKFLSMILALSCGKGTRA